MNVVCALQPVPKSIFLAGPTPRDESTPSWRPEALEILNELGFEGTVYVPESENWLKHDQYDRQIAWEWEALHTASVIAFWVPRDLVLNEFGVARMPAFTTNVEFGLYARSGKSLLGFPPEAPKMSYLHRLALDAGVPVLKSLRTLLEAAVVKTRAHPF